MDNTEVVALDKATPDQLRSAFVGLQRLLQRISSYSGGEGLIKLAQAELTAEDASAQLAAANKRIAELETASAQQLADANKRIAELEAPPVQNDPQ